MSNKGKAVELSHSEAVAALIESHPEFDRKEENESSFINFESLEKLMDYEEAIQNGNDFPYFFNDLRRTDSYQTSIATCRPFDTQQITFYSSASNTTLRSSSFKELSTTGHELPGLFLEQRENSVWWLDVQNPSEKALRLLCSAFRVHPLTVEDILMQEIQEKMENFPSYYFVCFRSFHMVETDSEMTFDPYTIYLIVFRQGTLTFSFTKSEHGTHVLDRIALLKDYISISRDWIFYALVFVPHPPRRVSSMLTHNIGMTS
jgi:Mg2+ and Co2+ transporter CorA